MNKVFIIHGFEGSPNGGWRPWLMGELEKMDVYACALAMPNPANPNCSEWIAEIARHIDTNQNDNIYLVGHSLGVPAILRYLESPTARHISGIVLVSGPIEKNNNHKIDSFLTEPFDFEAIKSKVGKISVIHGDKDPNVPLKDAETLSDKLAGDLIIIPNGGHLNGSSGWFSLPQCFGSLVEMMK